MKRDEWKEISLSREKAEKLLLQKFGLPHFYDEQWTAIRQLLNGKRILMIERTGFGKSLCYQFPASLFDGVTVVFSPLIALMRDQVKALNRLGIPARCVNYEEGKEKNEQSIQDALDGKVKILYIAPERQENAQWIEATRKMHLSMVVVDEAHTISVWGHDFRPAFRRIVNLVNLLPHDMPVLAVTATATPIVQRDIEQQIGRGILTIRGEMRRDNFRLHVIRVNSEEEKMTWLANHLMQLPGTGLIYTGTRLDTENYARWLQYNHLDAVGYNAGLDVATRLDIEQGLKENRWKCIVSTNALGMGIDKPDIRFVVHTQMPESLIHYYQEIGRAGRDGEVTYVILFYNQAPEQDGYPADEHLPMAFVEGARPPKEAYLKVIGVLKEHLLGEKELMIRTNMKQNQIRVIKADLVDQGIVKEVVLNHAKKYEYQYDAPELDTTGFERIRAEKVKDLAAMSGYVYTTLPRMEYLCRYLGDVSTRPYSGCDNTTEKKWTVHMTGTDRQRIADFRESYFPVIEVAERANRIVDGVAASYYGVSSVGRTIHRSKYEDGGDFPDALLRLTLRAFRKSFAGMHFDRVMYVPPTVSGDLVKNFAMKLARVIEVPCSHALVKVRETQAQKIFHNGYSKKDNVSGAFDLMDEDVTGLTILLVDDIYDSGATLKEIGRLLTHKGAEVIVPLVIAKTVGNDNI